MATEQGRTVLVSMRLEGLKMNSVSSLGLFKTLLDGSDSVHGMSSLSLLMCGTKIELFVHRILLRMRDRHTVRRDNIEI